MTMRIVRQENQVRSRAVLIGALATAGLGTLAHFLLRRQAQAKTVALSSTPPPVQFPARRVPSTLDATGIGQNIAGQQMIETGLPYVIFFACDLPQSLELLDEFRVMSSDFPGVDLWLASMEDLQALAPQATANMQCGPDFPAFFQSVRQEGDDAVFIIGAFTPERTPLFAFQFAEGQQTVLDAQTIPLDQFVP